MNQMIIVYIGMLVIVLMIWGVATYAGKHNK